MGDGWLMNPEDRWTYRFHRDDKAWLRDHKVFVDMGRPMPDGSPDLLKTHQHLRREQTEEICGRTWCIGGGRRFLLSGELMQNLDWCPSLQTDPT